MSNFAVRLAAFAVLSLAMFVATEPMASASTQLNAQSTQHLGQGPGNGGTDW